MGISKDKELEVFLKGKSEHILMLFNHFIEKYKEVGEITIHPAKTMIGVANSYKRIAWVTQLGKNFIHIVFPLQRPYNDNLCFQKIAQIPGDTKQFNHHFRMLLKDDVNDEVMKFMKMAFEGE